MARFDFGQLGTPAMPQWRQFTDPRSLFQALPAKDPRFNYLRGPQDQVLSAWAARRHERDTVVKMNTGIGKTLVGLLIAQSLLNDGKGPVVYLTPDKYLAGQVRGEATSLGLATVADPSEVGYSNSEAILVAPFHQLFNGRSRFGVTGTYRKAAQFQVGSSIVDDAHACLAEAASVFAIEVPGEHPAFGMLLDIFRNSIVQQSPSGALNLDDRYFGALQEVPWWAWQQHQVEVLDVLRNATDISSVDWALPLLADVLPHCRAVFAGDSAEIRPHCVPTWRLTGFDNALHRVYLTATLADDSILVRDLGAIPESVADAIVPASAGDLGDRLILVPQELVPGTSDDDVKKLVVDLASRGTVVVVVPSRDRAVYWSDIASMVLEKDTIEAGVSALRRNPRSGIVVLINRYDGVDLPGDTCHLLVLDGLPEAISPVERLDQAQLLRSRRGLARQLQRIEQGMGRATRSNDDYTVVLLMGSRLTQRLHTPGAISMLSPASAEQWRLSSDVLRAAGLADLGSIRDLIDQVLDRDPEWIAVSKARLAPLVYGKSEPDPMPGLERSAFEHATNADPGAACDLQQQAVNLVDDDPELRGYQLQRLASYLNLSSMSSAQQTQLAANRANRAMLRPIAGVAYERLAPLSAQQGAAASTFLQNLYTSSNELIIGFDALLADLVWGPRTVEFEQALDDLAGHLGLAGQRPERDTGTGPDNLWALPDATFLVIEAKSGVDPKHPVFKGRAEQLSNSMDWFAERYPASAATPLLVHPSRKFDKKAAAPAGCRVIDKPSLDKLTKAVRGYMNELASGDAFRDPDRIGQALGTSHLLAHQFLSSFSKAPTKD
ncbi:MAG TPA: helicase C-terminal domain-containing protein [Propionicimonas sp.]|nr:helicase C-terminal domain-containing protein [Propionicimonas sp.]